MTRLLILTSDGSVPDQLVEAVAERTNRGSVEARVLVPLSPVPDAWTWDEDRIDRCCTHVIRPDGKLDSFCRYYASGGQQGFRA